MREAAEREAGRPRPHTPRDLDHTLRRTLADRLERASVMAERRLLEGLLRREVSRATPTAVADAHAALAGQDDLVRRRLDGRATVTVPHVLAEEKRMLDFARRGRGAYRPLGEAKAAAATPEPPAAAQPAKQPPPPSPCRPGLLTWAGKTLGTAGKSAGTAVLDWLAPVTPAEPAAAEPPAASTTSAPPAACGGVTLNAQQRAAVDHVLAGRDRVTLLRGAAGVGKTTLALEAVRQLEAAGHAVHPFAPSAEASRGVMRSEGFAGADTVARLLVDTNLQRRVAGGVLWVDEAGLLGVRQAAALFEVARERSCRLVLVGDTRQHAAVDRGDALRLLETEAGLKPAQVTAVVRQSGDYRRAVELLAAGDVAGGFDRLDGLGMIRQCDHDTRHAALAADYLDATAAGRSVMVVAPTHAEGEAVTAALRASLRRRGDLDGPKVVLTRLKPLSLTQTRREEVEAYRPGLVLRFHQNAPGFRRGERLVVEGGDRGLHARRGDGRTVPLPLGHAARFGVFEPQPISLAAGDLVRLTMNGPTSAAGGSTTAASTAWSASTPRATSGSARPTPRHAAGVAGRFPSCCRPITATWPTATSPPATPRRAAPSTASSSASRRPPSPPATRGSFTSASAAAVSGRLSTPTTSRRSSAASAWPAPAPRPWSWSGRPASRATWPWPAPPRPGRTPPAGCCGICGSGHGRRQGKSPWPSPAGCGRRARRRGHSPDARRRGTETRNWTRD